jgi:hypothetical protein
LIYAEPSLEKRRGLGISVESKEKFSRIGGEVLNDQRGAAAKGKRKEASAKPKRTVAGGGEGKREGLRRNRSAQWLEGERGWAF